MSKLIVKYPKVFICKIFKIALHVLLYSSQLPLQSNPLMPMCLTEI